MVDDPTEITRREKNAIAFKEQLQPLFDQLTHLAMLGTAGNLNDLPEFLDNPHKFFERLVTDEKNTVRGYLLLAALDGVMQGDGKQKTTWARLAKDLVKDKETSVLAKEKLQIDRQKVVQRRDFSEIKEIESQLLSEVDQDSPTTKKSRG